MCTLHSILDMPRSELSGALLMPAKAEKFPISCQTNAVLFTREMSCYFSMCFEFFFFFKCSTIVTYHLWLLDNLSCWKALQANWYPWERSDGRAVDGELNWPSSAELQLWKGTRQCGWRVPEMCSLLSSPQDPWTYGPDSCQWRLQHLWASLHIFYGETITGVMLRHEWASGHRSCHTYCWGVWINDQMDTAGCTTLTLNCQLHCECLTVFLLYACFHSGSELKGINTCFLVFKWLKSLSRNSGSSFPLLVALVMAHMERDGTFLDSTSLWPK